MPMPAAPAELFAFLDRLGHCATNTVTHPPLFTVEQSQALRGTDPRRAHQEPVPEGQEGRPLSGDRPGRRPDRAQGPAPAARRDRAVFVRLRRAYARIARRRAGVGDTVRRRSTTRKPVKVVLDAAMMAHELLNYHPLVNTMTTTIARDDLVKFLEATGHSPRIEAVPGRRTADADRGLHSRPVMTTKSGEYIQSAGVNSKEDAAECRDHGGCCRRDARRRRRI